MKRYKFTTLINLNKKFLLSRKDFEKTIIISLF